MAKAVRKFSEMGMLFENGASTSSTTTVLNSNIIKQPFAIYTCSNPSRSVVKIAGTNIEQGSSESVVFDCNTAGTATANFFDNASVATYARGTVITNNTLNGGGVYVGAEGATIESNTLLNSSIGVNLTTDGATITGNKFMYPDIAIWFACHAATVNSNNINGANEAYIDVPLGFVSTDALIDVTSVYNTNGC